MFAIKGGMTAKPDLSNQTELNGDEKPFCALPPQTALPFAYAAIIA